MTGKRRIKSNAELVRAQLNVHLDPYVVNLVLDEVHRRQIGKLPGATIHAVITELITTQFGTEEDRQRFSPKLLAARTTMEKARRDPFASLTPEQHAVLSTVSTDQAVEFATFEEAQTVATQVIGRLRRDWPGLKLCRRDRALWTLPRSGTVALPAVPTSTPRVARFVFRLINRCETKSRPRRRPGTSDGASTACRRETEKSASPR